MTRSFAQVAALELELAAARRDLAATHELCRRRDPGHANGHAQLGEATDDGRVAALEQERLQLESMLAERSAQTGVLMETVEALQAAVSGHAAHELSHEHSNEGFEAETAAWTYQCVLKRLVKVTMDATSAAASAGLHERRAAGLATQLMACDREVCRLRRAAKDLGTALAESQVRVHGAGA